MTERTYWESSERFELEAIVVAHSIFEGRPSVVLDRTVFYPEAGGQMADRGTLRGSAQSAGVIDVQEAEGVVHHVLEGPAPAVGARVTCAVDAVRRREHMALHTGQHMLSNALLELCEAVTVSSRLGESACTIDVDRADVSLDGARRAEDLVNRIVDEDRIVKAIFPSPEELAALPLRKKPKVEARVRVVVVEGFDATPCGGTHCAHTAQVGLVWVQSVERYKGGTRVTFTAGPRARRGLRERADALASLAASLRCAPLEVSAIVGKRRDKLDEARAEAGQAWARLADRLAAGAPEDHVTIIVDEAEAALVEPLLVRLATGARVAAIGVRSQDKLQVTIARGPGSSADCGALMKALAAAHAGRGGGRPQQAGGQLPAGVDLEAALRRARG